MIIQETARSSFGEIKLLTITNNIGAKVTLSSLGAGITSILVPDSKGRMADVVLGYEDVSEYHNDGHAAGKTAGRFANRIAKGRFEIGDTEYSLSINNGPNSLHGGPTGFQNRLWDVVRANDNIVEFRYESADGEEGYPGNLSVSVTYRWTDGCELQIDMRATTDKETVINLTNHTYFNLGGHDSGSVLAHTLQLNAAYWLPTDSTLIPTGEISSVIDTPMDFTTAKVIGSNALPHTDFPALQYGKGYDNCWVADDYEAGIVKTNAVLHDRVSGRTLTISSSQPGVQVYTGNWLSSAPTGKGGYHYNDYDAVAIECQDLPDAPNQPNFPSTLLKPGEEYHRIIIFKFSN